MMEALTLKQLRVAIAKIGKKHPPMTGRFTDELDELVRAEMYLSGLLGIKPTDPRRVLLSMGWKW
jgi:hypothetical protein